MYVPAAGGTAVRTAPYSTPGVYLHQLSLPAVLGSTPCPTVQHVQNCNLFPFTAVLFMSSQKIANRKRKIANSLPLPVLLGEREDGMKLDQNKVILPHSIEALQ